METCCTVFEENFLLGIVIASCDISKLFIPTPALFLLSSVPSHNSTSGFEARTLSLRRHSMSIQILGCVIVAECYAILNVSLLLIMLGWTLLSRYKIFQNQSRNDCSVLLPFLSRTSLSFNGFNLKI